MKDKNNSIEEIKKLFQQDLKSSTVELHEDEVQKLIQEYSRAIFSKRNEIIDDFFICYAAQLGLEKGHPIDLGSIKIVETHHNNLKTTWSFEVENKSCKN